MYSFNYIILIERKLMELGRKLITIDFAGKRSVEGNNFGSMVFNKNAAITET